jgi:hypothetical protein
MPSLSNPAITNILPFNAAVDTSCRLEGMGASSPQVPSHTVAACALEIAKAITQLDHLAIGTSPGMSTPARNV